MDVDRIIVTCEHGGNRVPRACAVLFRHAGGVLESHRAYDPGALAVARRLAGHFDAPLHASTVTRLVVDLNRSIGNPRLFSEFTLRLPVEEREQLLARHYIPYRSVVERRIARWCGRGLVVLHLSVHSFVPRLNGQTRNADIGLLYDPGRAREKDLCAAWRDALRAARPELRIRRNYPYLGVSDGFATYLRRVCPTGQYHGIEIEFNQRLLQPSAARRGAVARLAAETLASVLARR